MKLTPTYPLTPAKAGAHLPKSTSHRMARSLLFVFVLTLVACKSPPDVVSQPAQPQPSDEIIVEVDTMEGPVGISCLLPDAEDFKRQEYLGLDQSRAEIEGAIKRLFDIGMSYTITGVEAADNAPRTLLIEIVSGYGVDAANIRYIVDSEPFKPDYYLVRLLLTGPNC